jgi:DNA-binding MarR family transcriptional regulator
MIAALPRAGRGLRIVNERRLAEQLDCDRATIVAIIDDLEGDGRLRRRRNRKRGGLLVEILDLS